MDDLTDKFGALSTDAVEWKPSSARVSTTTSNVVVPNSDLNPSAVKEFVPGQGWAAVAGAMGSNVPQQAEGYPAGGRKLVV